MLKPLLTALIALLVTTCCALGATLLPQGSVTFFNDNGAPLVGGKVYFYIPGTTTPKSTWRDAAGTVLNPNPVILDAGGRAVIYGSGTYQETVNDLNGNLIWSQPTTDTSANGSSWAGTSGGAPNVQTLNAPNFSFGDGQVIGFIAGFTNTGATTVVVNGAAPVNVVKGSNLGPISLSGGEIVAGNQYQLSYSATNGDFQILSFPLSVSGGLYSALVTSTGNAIFYSPIIDAAAVGFVGDGATLNNAQFATLATAVANGGEVKIGCGVYKISAATTINLAASKHLTFEGGGVDCTELWFSGTNGTTVDYGGQFSSSTFKDMTISTDSTSSVGLQWVNQNTAGAGSSLQYGPQNSLINVNFRGHDQYGVNANVWGTAFSEQNISNLSVVGGGCNQSPPSSFAGGTQVGTCYNLSGYVSGTSYSSNIRFEGVTASNCATAVFYGDYVQNVSITDPHFTGCKYGVATPGSNTELLSGLSVQGGTIYSSICDICEPSVNFTNLGISNVLLEAAPGAIILQTNGAGWSAAGNRFVGIGTPSTANTIGIQLAASPSAGKSGIASGNLFSNLTAPVAASAGVAFNVTISHNQMVGNNNDYVIGASSSGVLIIDDNPRLDASLLACNSTTAGDQFFLSDSTPPGYNGTAAGGGIIPVRVVCDSINGAWRNR